MKTSLKKNLRLLDDIDFRELELSISLASQVRNLITEFKLSTEDIIEQFKIKENQIIDLKNGSYPYDLRMISIVQTAYTRLHFQRAAEQIAKTAEETILPISK